MTRPKINPWPSLELLRHSAPADPSRSVQETIEGLQQQVDELGEHQDRTSFYLREIALWADHLKRH